MMKHLILISFTFLLAGTALFTSSCKKKKGNSDGNLEFSVDTLVFDTVFTTLGSTTGQFKVYNPDNKKLTIQDIQLVGGANSPFKLNFDGLQGHHFSELEIEGGDSLFCFVEVTLDPNNGTLPMIIEDSIRFRTNGQDQYVKLAAWGQDAYFHYNDINSGTWPNDKPHVIYGAARVSPGQTLNIPAGTDVYLHKLSFLYVNRGTLNVNGTAGEGNEVTFQGDRLEAAYDNVPGQYYGIYLDSARHSTISYAKIKNAIVGVHIESRDFSSPDTTLTIKNSEIWNCASYGILAFDRTKLNAENTLIHSNGVHSLLVLQGAEFTFTHCDLLGYGTGEGTTPAVGIQNYYDGVAPLTAGEFNNCVIYGTNTEQLVFDTISVLGATTSFHFRKCLIATGVNTSNPIYIGCLFGTDPAFQDPQNDNFQRWSHTVLNNNGTSSPLYTLANDILGITRDLPPANADIGVYNLPF